MRRSASLGRILMRHSASLGRLLRLIFKPQQQRALEQVVIVV